MLTVIFSLIVCLFMLVGNGYILLIIFIIVMSINCVERKKKGILICLVTFILCLLGSIPGRYLMFWEKNYIYKYLESNYEDVEFEIVRANLRNQEVSNFCSGGLIRICSGYIMYSYNDLSVYIKDENDIYFSLYGKRNNIYQFEIPDTVLETYEKERFLYLKLNNSLDLYFDDYKSSLSGYGWIDLEIPIDYFDYDTELKKITKIVHEIEYMHYIDPSIIVDYKIGSSTVARYYFKDNKWTFE